MIKDKVEELLPQMVEELLRQKIDNLSFNIQTTINGKNSSDLRGIIINELLKDLWNLVAISLELETWQIIHFFETINPEKNL